MDKDDARQTAGDLHRLAHDIEQLAEETDLLADEQVNTQTAGRLRDTQGEVQQELKQLISDLIQLHAESGGVRVGEQSHQLAYNGSVPIPSDSDTDLPPPRTGKPGRGEEGPPSWANAPDDSDSGASSGPSDGKGPQN